MHHVSRRIKHAVLVVAGAACLAGTVAPVAQAQDNGRPQTVDNAQCDRWLQWASEELMEWLLAPNERLATEAWGRAAYWYNTAREAGCDWAEARRLPPRKLRNIDSTQFQNSTVYVQAKKRAKPRPRVTSTTTTSTSTVRAA